MRKSKFVSLIALFASLNVVFDLVVGLPTSGVWFGSIFIIEPINGIILGPYAGFLSTLIGVMIGHILVPRETVYEFLFTLGAPIGALIAGLLYRGKWKAVLVYYVTLLVIYFSTPIARLLPIWGMWDTYLALIVVLFFGLIQKIWDQKTPNLKSVLAICAFIALEADILFRVFLLVPSQGYSLFYGLPPEALVAIWAVPAPLITPLKVLFAVLFTAIVGSPLIKAISNRF